MKQVKYEDKLNKFCKPIYFKTKLGKALQKPIGLLIQNNG